MRTAQTVPLVSRSLHDAPRLKRVLWERVRGLTRPREPGAEHPRRGADDGRAGDLDSGMPQSARLTWRGRRIWFLTRDRGRVEDHLPWSVALAAPFVSPLALRTRR